MTHTDICTSIEGEKLLLQCRQFNLLKPRLDPILNNMVYPFKMGISSKAIIEEEINPKGHKFRVQSLLEKDACLMGESIEGFSLKPLPATNIIHTGAYRGRLINTKCFAFAHIEIGLRALLQKKK